MKTKGLIGFPSMIFESLLGKAWGKPKSSLFGPARTLGLALEARVDRSDVPLGPRPRDQMVFLDSFKGQDKGPDWVALKDFRKHSQESPRETQIVPFWACWDAESCLGGKGGYEWCALRAKAQG